MSRGNAVQDGTSQQRADRWREYRRRLLVGLPVVLVICLVPADRAPWTITAVALGSFLMWHLWAFFWPLRLRRRR